MSPIEQTFEGLIHELDHLGAEPVRAGYYPEIFGNFIISFRLNGCEMSLVNERFELFLCDKLGGDGDRRSIARDIREQTPTQVRDVVRAAMRQH
ncbi:MAG TPA: hypothetical protein VHS33_11310 [Sphingomicrobium sp.]|jgi:hypothetical protein|nr:hypothetical protein [Sphingomicrobium sp.]